ncbi:MAG: hypothetical protein JNL90_11610 [Planctomycetes bacterium]|nr:hypothetical protein [Planctomycetota bacterium]
MRFAAAAALLALAAGAAALAPARSSAGWPSGDGDLTPFQQALERGTRALAQGRPEAARPEVERALERDPKSPEAWALQAELARLTGDADLELWALHRRYALRVAQKARAGELEPLRAELLAKDPIASDLFGLKSAYVGRMAPLAEAYEKERRPHSAIRVHQQLLALDPELEASRAAIERISAAPDPSLAETAQARDLFEGISDEWIREFDADHSTWEKHGILERENYVTKTDAGYEVMVRAAEAMEQMNAFYREFFRYGTEDDGRSVPKIALHIFKTRDEYLKLGIGPPVEWSGGHFTGNAVETYVGPGGFEEVTTTLFHEAAHQFVSLATTAVGWLNEGLASFFEGCRILANGTVLMNMPANHRLFPLAERMEQGWMSGPNDGVDPADANSEPRTAPTFRIVLENQYAWGPPWYAPTWGVVFFLWNYQDPVDGRFVYRAAFREFIDKSGGRSGEGAVENFEKVVLQKPQPPTKGVDFAAADEAIELPRTVAELDEVWKRWILELRDQQTGKSDPERPWRDWARHAITRKEWESAKEHFEKGIVDAPDDAELHVDFARFLQSREKGGKAAGRSTDRAAKLALRALQLLEAREPVDAAQVKAVDALLATLDPKRRTLDRLLAQLEASAAGLAERYLAADRPRMAMEISWRLGTELGFPRLFDLFERAARSSGKSLALWKLAYNEQDFDGWIDAGNDAFHASGTEITSQFGDLAAGKFDYQFLIADTVTSGDFSLEAELLAENNVLSFAGLVFGKKASSTFHTLVYYPGRAADARYNVEPRQAAVDLTSFYGPDDFRIWRHNVLPGTVSGWHKLRVDVVGRLVDVWCDGELVVTQEFPSLEVLRGSFGLITGPGAARWRNVRYLARHARDPGALIERELVLQRLKEEAARSGKPIGSSFVGVTPPFPAAVKWVREPRASFEEAGPVPQLLLFFSIQQNERLPLHGWLQEFAARWQDVGLKVICIASPDDTALLEYVASHPFVGSLGHDTRVRGRQSYGTTFEQYFIPRFNLPRALLFDIDGRVAWEGDPGYSFNEPWTAGAPSFLDTPMEELVAKRQLRTIAAWKAAWQGGGEAAWKRGDLAAALPLLQQADAMREALDPTVVALRGQLAILRAALRGVEGTAEQLARAGGATALPGLFAWGALLGEPVADDVRKALAPQLNGAEAKQLAQVWIKAKAAKKAVAGKEGVKAAAPIVELARNGPAPLAPRFAAALEAAIASGSIEAVTQLLEEGEVRIAGQWLAEEFFRW